MNETAPSTVPPSYCILTPLKDFQHTHCHHCTEHCNPNESKMLACILTAILQSNAYRYKVHNERGW